MRRLALVLAAALVASLSACSGAEPEATPAPVEAPPPPPPPAQEPPRNLTVQSGQMKNNESISVALGRLGVELTKVHEIVAALDGIFDFRKARPGDEFRVTTENGALHLFEFRRGPVEEYLVHPDGDKLVGKAREFEITTEVVRVSATLESSLYEALLAAGEDPSLAVEMGEVLAWDIDFYNDPRKGDTFQLLVERHTHDGKRIGYGALLAAEYDGQLVGKKRVFRYDNPRSGQVEYFGENGEAARRAFLKSPLKFAHVSSRYGMRRHPTLKYMKKHEGVDYAAGTGTPVWSVGDGTVTKAGWGGACGKMVAIRHNNGLESIYCHFSRIAEGIRPGAKVAQKRVIGYVGTTGRSTGPHLHYAVKRKGAFVNPLALKFPPADPIPDADLPAFRAAIDPYVLQLDGNAAFATTESAPQPTVQ
ncbi:M23 family metallopeptidase [Vulgatibacter sp.]|uniref:M23 family metallopeptidase n=1 Tax=Vulgatibacter sp. TaxID=1971226 RepID=UPI003567566F